MDGEARYASVGGQRSETVIDVDKHKATCYRRRQCMYAFRAKWMGIMQRTLDQLALLPLALIIAAGGPLAPRVADTLALPAGHAQVEQISTPLTGPASSCRGALSAERRNGQALSLPVTCLGAIVAPTRFRQFGDLSAARFRAASSPRPVPALGPTGIITTVAGGAGAGGLPTSYSMAPSGVALIGAGHVLISDESNNLVWLANLTGSTVHVFGQTIAAGRMASVAGNGTRGSAGDGGSATQAQLYFPSGLAVNRAGTLFIADAGNNRIRAVLAASGVISTVAGSGAAGFGGDGGPATRAELYFPAGVTLDGVGHLFIADTGNNRIREVVATGVITTVVGSGIPGFGGDGGPATQAELHFPYGAAIDAAGHFFIADTGNNRIRTVQTTTGIISTVAGTGIPSFGGDGGPAAQAGLYNPHAVAVDRSGRLLIADTNNNRIRAVLVATGVITTVAGSGVAGFGGDGGLATQAQLANPTGLAVDGAGNVFLTDARNNRLREVLAAGGSISTVAGSGSLDFSGDGGAAVQAELSYPNAVAVDGSGNVFLTDARNDRVREVLVATGVITTVAGDGAGGFGGDGGAATQAKLNVPSGVAIDGSGNLFIVDQYNQRIREVLAATGVITTMAGSGTAGFGGDGGSATQAQLANPTGVAVDGAGNLFIADQGNQRIREVLAATGVITTVAGSGSLGFSGDGGPATNATLNTPSAVAVDAAGNLFIADQGNQRIREVLAATGVMTTVAGSGVSGFSGDGGPATQADLSDPSAVAVDGADNLFFVDAGNDRIREVFAATGAISTVAGSGSVGFSGDGGPAIQATLNYPTGVAVDSLSDLFIADAANNRVRQLQYP